MLRTTLSVTALIAAGIASAQDNTMLVLDASGSMWGQIDGAHKITIAQDVVGDVLTTIETGSALGLMAYGHNRKGDCADIELLVSPGPAAQTAADIAARVQAIKPKGKTPLSAAVERAADVLKSEETPATVVLVTDGLETCDADPCALARQLEASGVDFTAHVVGFGLSKAQGTEVACLAEETGGTYLAAGNAEELRAALSQTVALPAEEVQAAPPPKERPAKNLQINVAMTADDPPLEEGEIARLDLRLVPEGGGAERRFGGLPSQSQSAEPGAYILRALYQGGTAEMPVIVEEVGMTHATLVLNAGRADIAPIPFATAFELPKGALSWQVQNISTNKRHDITEPVYRQVLGEGSYEVQAILDRNPKSSPPPVTVEITAGETWQGEVVLPNGRLRVTPVDEAGSRLPDSFVRYFVETRTEDGSRGEMRAGKAGARDPVYPLPGAYTLRIEDWGITRREVSLPIEVAPGQDMSFAVTLPADEAAPLQVSAQ